MSRPRSAAVLPVPRASAAGECPITLHSPRARLRKARRNASTSSHASCPGAKQRERRKRPAWHAFDSDPPSHPQSQSDTPPKRAGVLRVVFSKAATNFSNSVDKWYISSAFCIRPVGGLSQRRGSSPPGGREALGRLAGCGMFQQTPHACFSEELRAHAYVERILWPNGPRCPHCDQDRIGELNGSTTRLGTFKMLRLPKDVQHHARDDVSWQPRPAAQMAPGDLSDRWRDHACPPVSIGEDPERFVQDRLCHDAATSRSSGLSTSERRFATPELSWESQLAQG
jgi:hypothetical protein